MIIKYQNFRGTPNPTQYKVKTKDGFVWHDISDGDTFDNCQFYQWKPKTPVMQGFANITFFQCNLLNAVPRPDATIDDCLKGHKEFCTNHPDNKGFIAAGMPLCPTVCEHLKKYTEEVVIDGVVVLNNVLEYEAEYMVEINPNNTITGQKIEGLDVVKDTPIVIPKKFTTPTLTKKQLDGLSTKTGGK